MATEKTAATAQRPRTPRSENRLVKYLSEVWTELKKTNWPTKQELIAHTQLVIGLLIVVGFFIAGWDTLLGLAVGTLFRALGVEVPN